MKGSTRSQPSPQGASQVGQSPRVNLIQSVISKYRQAALNQTLREYPQLAAELSQRERIRTDRRRQVRSSGTISTIIGDLR